MKKEAQKSNTALAGGVASERSSGFCPGHRGDRVLARLSRDRRGRICSPPGDGWKLLFLEESSTRLFPGERSQARLGSPK